MTNPLAKDCTNAGRELRAPTGARRDECRRGAGRGEQEERCRGDGTRGRQQVQRDAGDDAVGPHLHEREAETPR